MTKVGVAIMGVAIIGAAVEGVVIVGLTIKDVESEGFVLGVVGVVVVVVVVVVALNVEKIKKPLSHLEPPYLGCCGCLRLRCSICSGL